jgi:hypothetical protein
MRNSHRIVSIIGTLDSKRPLVKHRSRWKDCIKKGLGKYGERL